ncbi:MAG: FAD-dependent oxidoreductase [Pseudomonadota bacterium]
MSEKIAVIGSGMAGLAAARLAHLAGQQVTVFEAQQQRGMDAHSLNIHGGLVDVPLRVMSPLAWQSVLTLAEQVGVSTFPVDTFTSCSWDDRSTWFRSSRLPFVGLPWVGSWRHLNVQTLTLARGLKQLAAATETLRSNPQDTRLLSEFLADEGFQPIFWRGLILPILTTICTCRESHLMAWPARDLMLLVDTILHGSTLRRLTGGTPALVAGLAQGLNFISGSPVVEVSHLENGQLQVRNARGDSDAFDRIIVATQANQLDFLSPADYPRERALLQGIRFDHGELWVHSDTRFLPRRHSEWSALNFQMSRDLKDAMFTVLVNAVEPTLAGAPPVLQTWNPLFEPAPEQVIARVPLARAVVHAGTRSVQEQLATLHAEPDRRVFFCGSWAYPGVPLLESAVRSAQAVAAALQTTRQTEAMAARP